MKVLVACEFSGIVREAFRALGHDAISCDWLPTEIAGPHIQGDVLEVLQGGWDVMIAFPPCTYLCSSGLHWNKRRAGRTALTEQALDFVRVLMGAPVDHIAIENPIGCISSRIGKPTQIIQPWEHGHEETKSTCLWLKNLPPLTPTKIMDNRRNNLTPSGQNKLGPSKDRAKIRSRTYPGIARAMAAQWSEYLCGTADIMPSNRLLTRQDNEGGVQWS